MAPTLTLEVLGVVIEPGKPFTAAARDLRPVVGTIHVIV